MMAQKPSLGMFVLEGSLIEHCKENNWLFRVFFGDEMLPSDVGIIMNHYKDPSSTTSIMECHKLFVFLVQLIGNDPPNLTCSIFPSKFEYCF